jgi:hypothetical protein
MVVSEIRRLMEASPATGWQGKRGECFGEAQKRTRRDPKEDQRRTDGAARGEVWAALRVQRIYGLV